MPRKSKDEPDDLDVGELEESMLLGITSEGNCVYIHSFDDDIRALEFLESLTAGFRAEILSGLFRRSVN